MRLSARIIIFVLLLVTIFTLVTVSATNNILSTEIPRQQKEWAKTLTSSLAESLAYNTINEDVSVAAQTLENIVSSNNNLEYAYILDFDNMMFAHTFKDRPEEIKEFFIQHGPGTHLDTFFATTYNGVKIKEYSFPIIEGLPATIHLGINGDSENIIVSQIQSHILSLFIASSVLAVVIAFFFAKQVASPLERLVKNMKGFADSGKFSTLSGVSARNIEARELEKAFNYVIEKRRQAEQDLHNSQASLVTAQSIAHVGSWVWDINTNDLTWSDEIFRIFGLQPQSVAPSYEGFLDFVHEDDRQKVIEAVNDALSDKRTPYELKHRLITEQGELRVVQEKGIVITDSKNKPVSMIGAVHDVTDLVLYQEKLEREVNERTRELRNTQDELIRSERLATLGQLTATVSHELRNPLGAIRPSLFIINKRTQDIDDDKLRLAVERVERSVARCDHIIDELLDYTRITDLEIMPVELDIWVDTLVNEQNIPSSIELVREHGLDEQLVQLDANRFRRAFINVFENAVQAMLKQDSTTEYINDAKLLISTFITDDKVNIAIRDNGYGISDDIMPRLFEPLFSTKGFGVGLGMPTVKQIMEQHDGGVIVDSEEGKGTTVTLWLPLSRDAREVA